MSNFGNVFKVQFLSGIKSSSLGVSASGKPKKSIGTVVVFAIMGLYIAAISTFLVLTSPADTPVGEYLTTFATMTTFLTLLTAISETKRSIFDAKDFELLSALPLKSITVVSGKIMAIYASELIYSAMCFVVPAIIASIIRGATAMLWVSTILGALLMPAVPMAVGSIIGFLFSLLASKFKYAKILETILYLAFFVGIYFFSYNMFYNMGGDQINNTLTSIGKLYPLSVFLSKGASGDIVSLLIFLGISVGVMAICFVVLSVFYRKGRGLLEQKQFSGKYSYKSGRSGGSVKILLKKEMASMFANPGVSINLFMGLVLPFVFPFVLRQMGEAILAMSVFVYSMVSMTTYAFSLEGQRIGTLKSFPVSFKDICRAKMANQMIFTMVSAVLFCILVVFNNGVSWIKIPFCMVAIIFQSLFNSTMGILRDVKKPKLNWTNEVQAVKQNTGMLVIMLFSMPVAFGCFIADIVLTVDQVVMQAHWIFKVIPYICTAFIYMVMWIIVKVRLNKKGEDYFARIS
ncbi:MAG: hypothetical protein K6F14_04075 [Clostridiales bacterium]|nr:hypothetical protein [Clostridiales bacterium]